MELTLGIPWADFNIPQVASEVIDLGMELAMLRLSRDTEFYDPETRAVHEAHVPGYSGQWARHKDHLRDSWVDWNFVNGKLVLYNTAPAARYLFHGNSPGGGGGVITPTKASYMTYYLRSGRGGPSWHRSTEVRSVEMTGQQHAFRTFIFSTVQKSMNDAIVAYEKGIKDSDVVIDDLIPQDVYRALSDEIRKLGHEVTAAKIDWQALIAERSKVPHWSSQWEELSTAIGQRYARLDELRRARGQSVSKLRGERKAVVAKLERTAERRVGTVAKKLYRERMARFDRPTQRSIRDVVTGRTKELQGKRFKRK